MEGISLTTFLVGYSIERNEALPSFKMGSFTREDIHHINFIDRGTAGLWNINMVTASDIFKKASKSGIQVTLLFLPGGLKERLSLYLIYLQGYFFTNGLTSLAKGTTDRYRPFTYLSLDQINKLEGKAKEKFLEEISGNGIEDSFFSGHASSTAYSLIFFAKVFHDYFPDSKWEYGVWGLSVSGTVLEAYFRVKAGEHFPLDVITGSLIGGATGFLGPCLHKKPEKRNLFFSINGGIFSLNYIF